MIEISESGKTLDARGLFCPSPVMQTNVELSKMQVGEILTVLADDPAAEDDIASWARKLGHEVVKMEKMEMKFVLEIKKIK
uniref:SirA family protein n=1 Tax=uncultured marine thaumarchaeote AD1000_71_D06 TaxID=1455937 RepID=A0A075FWB2_9ARCH|nr:SirA family protein [uncultured marine thaumarchaeote AD1000_71_D06]